MEMIATSRTSDSECAVVRPTNIVNDCTYVFLIA